MLTVSTFIPASIAVPVDLGTQRSISLLDLLWSWLSPQLLLGVAAVALLLVALLLWRWSEPGPGRAEQGQPHPRDAERWPATQRPTATGGPGWSVGGYASQARHRAPGTANHSAFDPFARPVAPADPGWPRPPDQETPPAASALTSSDGPAPSSPVRSPASPASPKSPPVPVASAVSGGSVGTLPSSEPDEAAHCPPECADQRRRLVLLLIDLADRLRDSDPALRTHLHRGLGELGITVDEPHGELFDRAHHNVAGSEPAATPAQDRRIASIERAGYHDGPEVLRRPEVVLFSWEEPSGE